MCAFAAQAGPGGQAGEASSYLEGKRLVDADSEPLPVHKNVNAIRGKGVFLGGGVAGLVERLKSGDAIKSPWTGRPAACVFRRGSQVDAHCATRQLLATCPCFSINLSLLRHWSAIVTGEVVV